LERFKEKILSRMRPDVMVESPASWQQQKSAETRLRILDATVSCLVEHGYSGLSTHAVTQRAGLSRGAMHHHYASRMELVAAVIEYTFYGRMERFLDDYAVAMRGRHTGSVPEVATLCYWKCVQTPEYAAYLELAVAARTDAELNSFFVPVAAKFDKVWSQEMIRSFPQWQDHWDALQVASDFTMAAMMGLLIYKPVFKKAGRTTAVRDLIVSIVNSLHKGIV
jgi:AcrR family transcriptional regulator